MWTILITAATLACDVSDSVDLTHTTLAADYPTITCIPASLYDSNSTKITLANMTSLRIIKNKAFRSADNIVSTIDLRNAAKLTTVDTDAFIDFKGVVHMENNAALISIGSQAFRDADNLASTIDLTNAATLTTIDDHAFSDFKGTVHMENNAALKTIGSYAFYQADNPVSTIDLKNAVALTTVGDYALYDFKGKVIMENNAALKTIGTFAFRSATNLASIIDLTNAVALTTVDDHAFGYFKGEVTMVGRYPLLEAIGSSAFVNTPHINNTVSIECVAANFTLANNVFYGITWTEIIIETDCSLIPPPSPPSPPAPSPVSAPAPSGEGASGSNTGLIAGVSVAGVVVLGGGYAVFKFVSAKATSGSGFNYLLF